MRVTEGAALSSRVFEKTAARHSRDAPPVEL